MPKVTVIKKENIFLQEFLTWIRTIGNHSGCHQMSERSFFYHGKQFPVCARCTGVGIGHTIAVLSNLMGARVPAFISVLMLAIMGTDWAIQEADMKESTNIRRLITGILGGFGLFNLYFMIGRKFILIFKKH
jgi:uncharacterized membrane protein